MAAAVGDALVLQPTALSQVQCILEQNTLALRQALVEPAARRGVRFEERALVDDMLDAAGGERGALRDRSGMPESGCSCTSDRFLHSRAR